MPWWLVPSSPTSPARSTAIEHRLVVLADVVDGLVEGPLEERRIERDDRPHPAHRETGRQRHRMLLGDADIEHPVRELGLELRHPGPGRHAGRDPDDAPVGTRQLDQLGREDRRVVRVLLGGLGDHGGRRGVVGHRFGRHHGSRLRRRGTLGCGDSDRWQGGPVEPDLVALGGSEAAALLGPDVDDGRSGQRQRTPERLEQRVQVMTRDDPDVGHPEVLEQLPGLGEVDDRTAKTLAQLEDRRADDGMRSTARS